MIVLAVVSGIILALVAATPFVVRGARDWNHQRRIAERYRRTRVRKGKSSRWVHRLIWAGLAIVLSGEAAGGREVPKRDGADTTPQGTTRPDGLFYE
jgi:hypothetical protein